MKDLFKDYKIFDINPSLLRSKNFYKNFIIDERKSFWEKRKKLNKSIKNSECFLCNNKKNNKLFLTHDSYNLMECNNCKNIFANIFINEDFIELVYNNSLYEESTEREILNTYEYRKNKFGKERFDYIKEKCNFNIKEHNLLDLGCGVGYFLKYLTELNIDCKGLELTDFLVNFCKNQKLNVSNNLLEEEKNTYNIITMFDVLEHLSTPITFFSTANKKLKKGGYILAYTPNIHSFAFKFQQGKQNLLLPYEHLCFYNEESLNFLATNTGFEIISIEYFGLDIIDYFSMKEYEDNFEYNERLQEIIPYLQALIDKNNISNHMRIIFKKVN